MSLLGGDYKAAIGAHVKIGEALGHAGKDSAGAGGGGTADLAKMTDAQVMAEGEAMLERLKAREDAPNPAAFPVIEGQVTDVVEDPPAVAEVDDAVA